MMTDKNIKRIAELTREIVEISTGSAVEAFHDPSNKESKIIIESIRSSSIIEYCTRVMKCAAGDANLNETPTGFKLDIHYPK